MTEPGRTATPSLRRRVVATTLGVLVVLMLAMSELVNRIVDRRAAAD